jgi:tRNA A-37 threonylcarbamoyl transferase component Bud32
MPDLLVETDAVAQYLRDQRLLGPDEPVAIRPLTGGVSNQTMLIERPGREGWVSKQALAKLRVAVEWRSDPARVHREALGLQWLERLAPPDTITPLVHEDHEYHLIIMRAVDQPHDNWKDLLLAGRVDTDHVRQFGALLGTIHRRAHDERDAVSIIFDDRSFFESLRLEPYYRYTGEQVSAAAPFCDALIADNRARRLTIVHGDYSPKNVLVHDGRLILIDHEVIHFGDPAFDLGFALSHLLSKAHHVAARRVAFVGAASLFYQSYVDALGAVPWARDLEPFAVRNALGCLLARVRGRSTLEYMPEAERADQARVVLGLMNNPPATVDALAADFVEGLASHV